MTEFDGMKLKAGLQAWAAETEISITDFRKQMDYTYSYSWDLLRGKAIFSAEAFGRFILAYGIEAGQDLMQLAGYPDALPKPEGAQTVPVVYISGEEK